MTAGAPWSVKGIDPRAREVAKELAASAGMTLGEWLNQSILDGEAPQVFGSRRTKPLRSLAEEAGDPFDRPKEDLHRLAVVLDRLADRLDGSEARTGRAISSLESTVRTTFGRLEQAIAHPAAPARQEARADRHEGVLRALESALSRLATQVQDGEARTRDAMDGLRARIDRAETRPLGEDSRMDQIAAQVGEVQDRSAAAMHNLREAFAGLDDRLARLEATAASGQEERIRELSFRLGERMDAARAEMSRELTEVSGRRIDQLERALSELSNKVDRVEQEAMGRSARPDPGFVAPNPEAAPAPTGTVDIEGLGQGLVRRFPGVFSGPSAELARLGDEISRGEDPLSVRDEEEPFLPESTWELPADREISRRIRQSEDRTARLLEEARQRLDLHFPRARPSGDLGRPDQDPISLLSDLDDEDAEARNASGVIGGSGSQDLADEEMRREEWSLAFRVEGGAKEAQDDSDLFEEPRDIFVADQVSPALGFGSSPPPLAVGRKRVATPGLASLAVFCISASLVGFAALTLFDGPREAASAKVSARTEPDVLAAAPRPPGAEPTAPVRAAVALTPAPSVIANPGERAEGPAPAKPEATSSSLTRERFRKAQSALAAGRADAVKEIQALADTGHPPAMRFLSGLYAKGGAGLSKDPGLARSWIRRAAEAGDRVAMHSYALDLMNGVGGPRDPAAAVGWFQRAAQAGLVESQFNMGAVYERGMGVPQDIRQAFVWYSRAAESGDGEALRQVERLRPALSATAIRTAGEIRLAQTALGRLGYYTGPADGALNPQLRTAIEAYQKDQKTPTTGLLDDATLRRLAMLGR
ncbi:MAG: peptidoglycan-binding protein [Phenylobacterium sp.]